MRELTQEDAVHGVLGGGVLACGGGGWKHHGELMGRMATELNRPVLAGIDELPEDSWVATVTAIGAPAAKNWEIRPVDYVHALQELIRATEVPISAVMTAQNGYSTTLNGWIQSSVLGVKVLDAAGDVRAHPTGKLGSLGLAEREGYVATQVVSGGNRALHGHFLSVNRGTINTCDDVLRDISVRTGGFIAAARNPVELSYVREHAAHGSISLALDLGRDMAAALRKRGAGKQEAFVQAVVERLGGTVVSRGPLGLEVPTDTHGGWDHGTFRIGDFTVPYLNEYMAIESGGERIATYPDTIILLDPKLGEAVAVKDAAEGQEVVLVSVPASGLPVSSSAIDESGLAEIEQIMGIDFLKYRDSGLVGGTAGYVG
ncbi:hypothetical protein C5E06_01950 [Pseudoclavibacter sp. RFBI5]|uniref:S-methyl thiohydantoin desulfurase domain-containing protein n=1 Tax=Pseudoclavibacter sp. RFBI5 TaxID=2080578 RepID=UPI000CE72CC3|nr:DUF917 family protein [Pseudoclavibacter sp. RFBI5]PPG05643.1 hypothetical protein C5E06_01950 [Pseudoclavibacter sp. RFBI5]